MKTEFSQTGFSLMEIMIALIIIAIIAGIAYPRYQKMVTRTRQTEAKTTLNAVYKGQEVYNLRNLQYASNLSDLDMEIPQNALYSYSLDTADDGKSYTAKAEANIDDDPTIDTWTVDQTNSLTNVINDVLE